MNRSKPLFLFSVYDKAHKADLTAGEKKELAVLARQLKKAFTAAAR